MIFLSRRGFTLVEIITVVFIVALLATALYIGSQPYMKRSRDTKRITDIGSYMNIIDAYGANFETYPSNEGSGGTMNLGYCLSELYTRPSYPGFYDKQFQTLGTSSVPPMDPNGQAPIGACNMTGSYLYSRMQYGAGKEIALVAARLEIKETANYGTGADLILTGSINSIINARKGNVPTNTPDSLFVVYRLR